MSPEIWRWSLGLFYIVAVATIWIAASYIVQSVVDAGISPFLITYICNSLFVIYIPIVEIARYFEDLVGKIWSNKDTYLVPQSKDLENVNLLQQGERNEESRVSTKLHVEEPASDQGPELPESVQIVGCETSSEGVDAKGQWTRTRVAKVSLLICPFWFFAQLTFNLSLKYTTVTSNTILSSASSLFTFLVSLAFLDDTFTWVKLISVLLCMGGTIIVSLGDSKMGLNAIATDPLLGDILALVSAFLYAVYITLIRKKLPDERKGEGQASMAEFLGYLGLFNLLIFLPVALLLNFSKLEPFYMLSWNQLGLIIGKGLLDNVLSDYLWAKAVFLTTTTVATAGLTIQVPLAAVAFALLDIVLGSGLCPSTVTINILLDGLCHESHLREANGLLEKSYQLEWDVSTVNYNTVMSAFCEINEWDVVLNLLSRMLKRGVVPNTRTNNIVIHSLRKAGKLGKAKHMKNNGVIVANVVTYNTLIHGFLATGAVSEVNDLLKSMLEEDIQHDLFTYVIRIDYLCKKGEIRDAYHLFRTLERQLSPDVVVYSTLICGLVRHEEYSADGRLLLRKMLSKGLVSNAAVFYSVIKAFCSRGYCETREICIIVEEMLRE